MATRYWVRGVWRLQDAGDGLRRDFPPGLTEHDLRYLGERCMEVFGHLPITDQTPTVVAAWYRQQGWEAVVDVVYDQAQMMNTIKVRLKGIVPGVVVEVPPVWRKA